MAGVKLNNPVIPEGVFSQLGSRAPQTIAWANGGWLRKVGSYQLSTKAERIRNQVDDEKIIFHPKNLCQIY